MIAVAPTNHNSNLPKASSASTKPSATAINQGTKIGPIKALSFGAAGTVFGGPQNGLALGLDMAALDKTGGTRVLDKAFDRLGIGDKFCDACEKLGVFKFVNSASERLGLYTPGKVPYANDVKTLFSDVINNDIARARLDKDKVLMFDDKSVFPKIAKRAEKLAEKILAENSVSFSASDKKASGDTFSFNVRTSNTDIALPSTTEPSMKEYQLADEQAMSNARAYILTRDSNKDGSVKIIRLTDSEHNTLSVFYDGENQDSLKVRNIHVYKNDRQPSKKAA